MEHDSASSCESCLRDFDVTEDLSRSREVRTIENSICTASSASRQSLEVMASQPKLKLGMVNRSLSSQVMEYYHKYSQNTNLDQYFSLPTTSTSPEAVKYYYSIYELNPKLGTNREDCIGEEYSLRRYVPRERRRWVRPPLIGQSSNTDSSTGYVQPLSNPESPSPDFKCHTPEIIIEEKNENQEILTETVERKVPSPTSSIASHKPLEWDSGADVGYFNSLPQNKQGDKKLSTIERMALARGCSAALRLDPEGTTESGISGKLGAPQRNSKPSVTPDANSTSLLGNISGSESEIEITPIVKNHLPGIIAGNSIKSNERSLPRDFKQQDTLVQHSRKEQSNDTSKLSFSFKIPTAKKTEPRTTINKQNINKENICLPTSPLKKSTSMNTLAIPFSKLTLKRSQSELNLYAKDKNRAAIPLIFNSSSSIATIVNKPSTCDKVIQTSLNACSQESVGVQVSVIEEEKPPLPKRGTSLQKSMTVVMKNSKGTYRVRNSRNKQQADGSHEAGEHGKITKSRRSCSEPSEYGSSTQTPQPDETENITGRANSFEYFPGHIYENVPNGSGSRVSSTDTGRSQSTLPNTSSSINEKLWGDSDSLVRDLERSVNILKSLVDANKCDKDVKKRLIHHVVKRLITAKYTDDRIEHNLEDNVPWNPDDARNKVYRTEILQALTKKHTTSDSSGDWNTRKETACDRKPIVNGRGITKNVASGSSSDKIDKHTDRTETDGRKARMGLRSDDCRRSTNTPTEPDKSESSECFFPHRGRKGKKAQDLFCAKERCKISRGESSISNSTPADHNRMLLDAVLNNRRPKNVRSSNTEEQVDWRLLTTMSERQFEMKKCGNSDSGDSKLVSYAEMEKRNQLIWITNEISHLSNLKKLLEEPRRVERSRMSPRKSRSTNVKSMPIPSIDRVHGCVREDDYLRRTESDGQANSLDEPWSSHCNLAACQPPNRINSVIQRIRKRNSCAQTATNVTSAHSKTGGEIVSASNIHHSTMKLVNTGVQTEPQEASTIPTLIQSEIVHYIKCPAHNAMHFQNSFKGNVETTTSQCLKHCSIQNVLPTCVYCLQERKDQSNTVHGNADHYREVSPVGTRTPLNCANDDSTNSLEIVHPCTNKEVNQFKQKETKNQINASKSRYTCDCKRESKRPMSKGCQTSPTAQMLPTNNVSKCEECQKKVSSMQEKETVDEKGCNCTTVCECDNEQSKMGRAALFRSNTKSHQDSNGYASSFEQNGRVKLCGCSTDCSCENKGGTHHYGHWPEAEDRPIRMWPYCTNNGQSPVEAAQCKVQNSSKCNCEKDCLCSNRTAKNAEEKLYVRGYQRGAGDSDRSCKYCGRCNAGTTASQNVKKSGYHQEYPKAVAYELSFAKEKVPLPNRIVNGNKTDGCACNTINRISLNKNTPQTDTLQDYLTRNKADFVSNAETRRQYMSEISHLRQLRKEKRVQLLAMASTSSVLKSPKSFAKPTVCTLKKVSDEEIRQRLRKRYLRWNEVRQKKRQQEKQEETRRNKLMAKIFGKKLQQKVLRGQVDLSQSVSVISNM
ncbi:PREDICTED: uncharacterized protein LOC107186765 [Dufourea novaeangliae]|uniref:ALMS motif domain-containing protein n=1 Tax=Dufourea novaeangliae TaxID=178035 RepID=A0A154PBM3_DUFNO|nr:PREDICTED: uncharacterized protein LOC107186765 [Dufourea novaeangliae]KZC08590.1 hypothetical protein WN55_11245 [Dufourea novaeangliae]